eukprot:TRINITY_DN2095_c0_g1_i1.p1 TRINITY_DN2095_c0_g1~~TRINITY_DN2095_c0_g1_i1.p1  ORF type:complete len:472 (-),score=103.66 TRINITY_DN2095_c0_g1_i1:112-1527(-)
MGYKSDRKGNKGGKNGKHGMGGKNRGRDTENGDDCGRPPWEVDDAEESTYRSKGKGRNEAGGDKHDGNYEDWDCYQTDTTKAVRSDDRGVGKRGCNKIVGWGCHKRGEKSQNDDMENEAESRDIVAGMPVAGKPLNSSATAFQPSGMFSIFGMQSIWGAQPAASPPLWVEYTSDEGAKYYYNSKSGLTQWDQPPELSSPKPPPEKEKPEPALAPEGKGKESIERGRGNREQGKDDAKKGKGRGVDRERGARRGGDGDNALLGDRDRGGRRGGESEEGARNNAPRSGRNKKRAGASGGDPAGKGKGAGKDVSEFGPPGCNLFVFHLPDDWTDNELHEHFSPHGTVVSAKVMKELGTGRSRGFGFVSYDDRVSAATAIKKMQGLKILGKRLKVEFKKGEGDDAMDNMDDIDGAFGDDDASRGNSHDDERLLGYLRAISAKNVVQTLKASEIEASSEAVEPSGEADVLRDEDAD